MLFCNSKKCGGCKKDVGKSENDYYICIVVFGNYADFTYIQLVICPNCLRKIPESLREPQETIVSGADVVNICVPKIIRNKVRAKPYRSVHRNVVKFCAGDLAKEIWTNSAHM